LPTTNINPPVFGVISAVARHSMKMGSDDERHQTIRLFVVLSVGLKLRHGLSESILSQNELLSA